MPQLAIIKSIPEIKSTKLVQTKIWQWGNHLLWRDCFDIWWQSIQILNGNLISIPALFPLESLAWRWRGGTGKRLKSDTQGEWPSRDNQWLRDEQPAQLNIDQAVLASSALGRSVLLPAALCEPKGSLSKRQIVNGSFYVRGTIQASKEKIQKYGHCTSKQKAAAVLLTSVITLCNSRFTLINLF